MLGLSIISVMILIIISIVFFKITKVIWKTILFTLLILLVVLGVTGYLVYQDMQEIINSENMVLIVSEQGVQTGANIYKEEEFNIDYITEEELSTYSNYLREGEYESILGDKILLVVLNTSMFNNLNKSISINGEEFSTKEGIDMIMSNSTLEFLDRATEIVGLNESIITKEEMIKYKLQINLILLEELIREEKGTKTLFQNTQFYPERLTIKLIKQIPSIIGNILPE
jgi:hypothetical protein